MPQPFDQKVFSRSPLSEPALLSKVNWEEMQIFLAVAKAKSFGRAALELNLSAPTVSNAVRRLQDVMGTQLLISNKQGVSLTVQGLALAEKLLDIDESIFNISRNVSADARSAEGPVRVSATEALAGLFIVPGLVHFVKAYPKVRLEIRNPINLTNFRENQTDIALSYMPVQQDGLECRPLGSVHLVPMASPSYVSQFGLPTADNLQNHLFLDTEYYSSNNEIWRPWRQAVGKGVIAHQCDNSFAYALMAKNGLGIALLGSFISGSREAIPLDLGFHITLPLYLITSTDRLQSRAVHLVFDWLAGMFGPTGWFSPDLVLGPIESDSLLTTYSQVTHWKPAEECGPQ